MSYEVYKVIHITGIMVLFLSLGGFFFAGFNQIQLDKKQKRPWMIMHGVSMFFVLFGGFGLLARIGIKGSFPTWVWLKLVVWVIFGGIIFLLIRKQNLSKATYIITLLLGVAAVYIANYKPFL